MQVQLGTHTHNLRNADVTQLGAVPKVDEAKGLMLTRKLVQFRDPPIPAGGEKVHVHNGLVALAILLIGARHGAQCFGDLFDKGVIDPVRVTRLSLEHAASVAALLLTTEALVAEELIAQPGAIIAPGFGDLAEGMARPSSPI